MTTDLVLQRGFGTQKLQEGRMSIRGDDLKAGRGVLRLEPWHLAGVFAIERRRGKHGGHAWASLCCDLRRAGRRFSELHFQEQPCSMTRAVIAKANIFCDRRGKFRKGKCGAGNDLPRARLRRYTRCFERRTADALQERGRSEARSITARRN